MPITALIVITLAVTAWWFRWLAQQEARDLLVTRQRLACPGLPTSFNGLRVLHVTDLHLGSGHSLASTVRSEAERLDPDLIVLTGDLLGAHTAMERSERLLRGLAERWPTYVVLGNADVRAMRKRELVDRWQRTGATVLVNERAAMERNGDRIWIVGVDDPHQGHDSLDLALRKMPPDQFTLLLAHSPDVALRARAREANLVLCGHTHGGQICFPGWEALYTRTRLPRQYASGLHRVNGATLLISRGAGSTRLGMRLHCPPEINLLTLVSRQTSATS